MEKKDIQYVKNLKAKESYQLIRSEADVQRELLEEQEYATMMTDAMEETVTR